MEQLTSYRIKGKTIGLEFLFKYDLSGNLKLFEVSNGQLDEKQQNWLFRGHLGIDLEILPFSTVKELNQHLKVRFPSSEKKMIDEWLRNQEINSKFEIEVAPADLSFEALWNLYDNKVSKLDAQKAFKKLKESEVIKCFVEIPYYLLYLKKNPGIGKLHLATYINKRRFEDERPFVESRFTNNSMIKELAEKKTDK